MKIDELQGMENLHTKGTIDDYESVFARHFWPKLSFLSWLGNATCPATPRLSNTDGYKIDMDTCRLALLHRGERNGFLQ